VSAIDELVDQLIAVRAVVDRYDDVLCNVGTITGGGRTNVVPGFAAADIGFRSLIRRVSGGACCRDGFVGGACGCRVGMCA